MEFCYARMNIRAVAIVVTCLLSGIQAINRSSSPVDLTRIQPNVFSNYESEMKWIEVSTGIANTTNITACPPWFIPDNTSTGCTCGSTRENIVKCDNVSQQTYILTCYAMTYYQGRAVLGQSFYGCFLPTEPNSFYAPLPPTVSELNQMMCGYANREGQLCGRCKDGFAAPIYSYDMACVRCSEHTTNWVKYIAAAFLPLTGFLAVVIVFRISVNSGHLNGFVCICQLLATPLQMRMFASHANALHQYKIAFDLLFLYAIWNLDFFRQFYNPFCLYPDMTTLEALAFDYIIAVYPLALIAIMYLFVKLHDHNFRPVVWLWKPFHFCTARFRRQLDIRVSLVDAYATFFVLSYVKILLMSFAFLLPTQLIDIHGHTVDKHYLYYDATVEFFGETHRPYAILAIAVLVVFVFSPLLLLIVYQCRCFHRCTQHCGFTCNILHTFMDAFQGCYKDGTNGTRDCRYFPVVYLMLRILLGFAYMITRSIFFYPLAAVLWTIAAFLVAIIRPYKVDFYNGLDIFLLMSLSAVYALILLVDVSNTGTFRLLTETEAVISIVATFPLIYMVGCTLSLLIGRRKIVTIFHKVRAMFLKETPSLEDSLPHRMTHVDVYTPLLLGTAAENDQDESRQWTENTAYGV